MKSDLLSEALGSIRLSGAMFLRGEYSAPWAFDSPEAQDLSQLLAPDAERLILFHIIRKGRAWVSAKSLRIELAAGDMAILPHADRHLMGSLPHSPQPVPIAALLPAPPWQSVPLCRFDGGGEETSVVCGYLKCGEPVFNSVLRTLPPLIRVSPPKGPVADLFAACVNFALNEKYSAQQSGVPLTSRVPEMLLTEALRLHSSAAESGTGWLAAAADRVLSRALEKLHAHPARTWRLSDLARAANTSASVLDERFRTILGKPPMRYLTELRMQLAANALARSTESIAGVALAVGYSSEEAFSRAFKKQVGLAPSAWRSTKADARSRR